MDPGSPSYGTSDVSFVQCLCFTQHVVTGQVAMVNCLFHVLAFLRMVKIAIECLG